MTEKKNFKILIEGVINKMIPSNKSFVITKTSKILNTKKFIKIVKKDKNLKKKIKYMSDVIEKSKIKNYDYYINEIFQSKIIEKKIETQLLEDYFTSEEIIKKLNKRSDLFFKRRKKKNINNLLRLVKKRKIKYKKL
jgi:hypothetical protein